MRANSSAVKTVGGILVLGAMVLAGCRTAHDVAVTSFKVIDAPANYVRQHIDKPKATPTPAAIASDSVRPGRTMNSSQPSAPVQPKTQTKTQTQAQTQVQARPTATPRATRTTSTESSRPLPSPAPHSVSAPPTQLPTAKPVPGKPGYVFSPFDPNGGYVDVTGFTPGSKVKDPYSGKVFLVP